MWKKFVPFALAENIYEIEPHVAECLPGIRLSGKVTPYR